MNNQNDRELLELAAKAAGVEGNYEPKYFCGAGPNDHGIYVEETGWLWNPIDDSGDALRLAVKLGLSVVPYPIYQPEKHSVIVKQRRQSDTMREANPTQVMELYGDDPYAATRRAIVLAAAAID